MDLPCTRHLAALLAVAVLTGCGTAARHHAASTSTPAASPAATSITAPALTPAETRFVGALQANLDNHGRMLTTTDAHLAAIGEQLCTALQDGASQGTVLHASSNARNAFAMSPHAFVRLTEKDLCRQYLPKILIRFSGSGIRNSRPFNVPSGTITAKYSYNCGSFGPGNFISDLTDGSDDQTISNALGSHGHQVTTLYPQDSPGQYHLSVNSECSWHLVLISG